MQCNHKRLRFARRTFSNQTIHYCVQCCDCGYSIKRPEFGNRLWIKHEDIPAGVTIYDFDDLPSDSSTDQGGLFNE